LRVPLRVFRYGNRVLAPGNLTLPRIGSGSYHAAAVQSAAALVAWMHCGANLALDAIGIRTMPQNAILTLRVVVTLACLVGVPVVALVGIPSERTGGGQFGVTAEQPERTPARTTISHRSQSPGMRPSSSATRSTVADPPPSGTIKEISADTSPVYSEGHGEGRSAAEVNPATFEAAAVPDPLTQQLQQLQELGASYYRLECSPNAVADFAFHCRLAGVEQPFAATASTPTAAVDAVIRAIETWRMHPPEAKTRVTSIYQR